VAQQKHMGESDTHSVHLAWLTTNSFLLHAELYSHCSATPSTTPILALALKRPSWALNMAATCLVVELYDQRAWELQGWAINVVAAGSIVELHSQVVWQLHGPFACS